MSRVNKIKEKGMQVVFLICACISVIAVVYICKFIFQNAIPAINEIGFKSFVFGKVWKPKQELFGIFPMIVSSIFVTLGAVIVGVPIGLMTAVFMSCYCPKKIYRIIKPLINLLSSVPSVIFGFFFLVFVVPIIQAVTNTSGKGMLTASLLLGVMILPTIVSTAESSIRAVPQSYFEGSMALGATKEISIFKIVVPAAKSGIVAGVILGIGRAIGETMAVVMVVGNQPILPQGITSGVRTLTGNIVLEMAYASGLHRKALIATAAVLFVFILIINLCFAIVTRRKDV